MADSGPGLTNRNRGRIRVSRSRTAVPHRGSWLRCAFRRMGEPSGRRTVSESWFATRELPGGVFLVAEPGHVNSFLVVGAERAALVDSGLGIASIRTAVTALTDRPVVVVNTHHHFDHVGGNAEFGERAIHELGAGPLAEPVPAAHLDAYVSFARDLSASVAAYREVDERFFSFLSDETIPRRLPDGFDPGSWVIEPPPPGRLLREGDQVDLGGRSLHVIHTPGHTPDSICLLDE